MPLISAQEAEAGRLLRAESKVQEKQIHAETLLRDKQTKKGRKAGRHLRPFANVFMV